MIAPFNSDQRVIVTSPPKKTIRPTKKGGNLSGHLPSPKFSAFKFSAHYICQSELLLILILSWEDKCTWSYFNGQSQRKPQIEIFCRGKQINTQFPYFSQKMAITNFFPFLFFSFFLFWNYDYKERYWNSPRWLPSRTFRWFVYRFHRICRSNGQW